MPGLEVRSFHGADAEQNAQNIYVGNALRQRRIKTAATLLDEGEVESRGECDGLDAVGNVEGRNVGGTFQVIVCSGNSGAVHDGLGLREGKFGKIGVIGGAAVAGPEAGVDGEIHQVGEAAKVARARGFAAGQVGEWRKVNRLGADGFEVGVNESLVTQLVVGVVVNVLRHVAVENLQRSLVIGAAAADARLFGVLDSTEFGVLDPQIAFKNFRGRQKAEDGNVALGDGRAGRVLSKSREAFGHDPRSDRGRGAGQI